MIEEQYKEKTKELYLRLFSADICNLFEDLLEDHDITIPSEEREGEDGEARIFGDVYYDLEAWVTDILAKLCEEVKATPEVAINIEDYNGFVDESFIPRDKIMVAVLNDGYYEEKGSYPEKFTNTLPNTAFVFDIPEDFIQKYHF